VLQPVGHADGHALEDVAAERRVALEELLERRGRYPDQPAWLLAAD
jgi:hypothetical protein